MTAEYAKAVQDNSQVAATQTALEKFTRGNLVGVPEFSETWSSYMSNDGYTQSTEGKQDDPAESLKEEASEPVPEKKKRGRKLLRPFDPVRKKTEEKDKYWLRAFRAYMRIYYPAVREHLRSDDQEFWDLYLSSAGKPGKGNRFASYGKVYKHFIFSHDTFSLFFRQWFREFGEVELSKKCARNSDLWLVFHEYATHDLCFYSEEPRQDRMNSPVRVMDTAEVMQEEISLDVDMNPDALLCSPFDESYK